MWSKERIAALRDRYGETQEDFCKRLRASVWTLRSWEQGSRAPNGQAEMILDDLEKAKPKLAAAS